MSFLPFFRAETNRFPGDPGAGPGDVGNSFGPWRTRTFCCLFCRFSGAGPGDVPDIFFNIFGHPRKHVGNCGRFGTSPGGLPYKFCGGRPGGPGSSWNDFGQIADHLRDDRERACSSLAPARPRATPARPRPGARRPRGRRLPAGALLLPGVSCVRPPPGAFVPLSHTRARRAAGGLQHACARSPV